MDIYRKEAARHFNIPYEDVTEDQREEVKKLMYFIQYGRRPSTGMPIEDEIPIRSEHDKKVFKKLFESSRPSAKKTGKIPIFFGTAGAVRFEDQVLHEQAVKHTFDTVEYGTVDIYPRESKVFIRQTGEWKAYSEVTDKISNPR